MHLKSLLPLICSHIRNEYQFLLGMHKTEKIKYAKTVLRLCFIDFENVLMNEISENDKKKSYINAEIPICSTSV